MTAEIISFPLPAPKADTGTVTPRLSPPLSRWQAVENGALLTLAVVLTAASWFPVLREILNMVASIAGIQL